MTSKIEKFVDEKLVPFVFITSQNPILFHDLLEANRQLKEGLIPSSSALGYRIKLRNMYIAFLVLIHLFFILPGTVIFHNSLAKLDCHLSIILAIVVTGAFFIGFTAFRDYMVDKISQQRVKEGWRLHFPLFDFDSFSDKVAAIYTQAVKKKISRGELEFFVMSELSKEGEKA
jgi:membrane-bound acyltransferase YfiQ involved in biofilm formation